MALSEAVTALLSPHKSKGKWPDPRASVGDIIPFVGLGRKYTCWKAVGPAQKLFNEKLGPSLRVLLHGCAPSSHEVYITFCMIGKTKETAAPKVIFSCPDETVRKNLRKHIEESSILASDQFTGIQLGDSSVRPGIPIRWTAGQGTAEGRKGYGSQDTSEESGSPVFSMKSRIGLGDLLLVRNQPGKAPAFRKGTAGPILYWENKEFCLTVDHLFYHHDASVGDPHQPTCSIDGLSDDASESDVDPEQDCLREASLTSEDGGDSPLSWSSLDWEKDTTSTSNSQGSSANQAPSDVLRKQHGKGVEQERCLEAFDEDTSVQSIGTVRLNSEGSSLDYALIDVTGKTVRYPNVLCTSKFISSCVSICDFSEIPQNPVDICTVTATSGPVTGVLRPDVTYVRRPNSIAFGAMHEVELNGTLANQDSGSAVVDSKSGCFYGIIVAGTPGTGAAFVIPAVEVLQDIERQLGITLSLSDLSKQTASCTPDMRCQQRTAAFVQSPAAAYTVREDSVRFKIPASAKSIFSDQSVASTVPTEHSHANLLPAHQNLVDLIANDFILKPLFTVALGSDAVGTEIFRRDFYRLLKIYGRELKAKAKSQQHFMAASFVYSQARFIAQGVIHLYESIHGARRLPFYNRMRVYAALSNIDNIMPTLQSSDTEEDETPVQGNLAPFSALKGFLTSGKPLETLRDSLKDFVHVLTNNSNVKMETTTAHPAASTTSQGVGYTPATSSDKRKSWRLSRIASSTNPDEHDSTDPSGANYGERGIAPTLKSYWGNPEFEIHDVGDLLHPSYDALYDPIGPIPTPPLSLSTVVEAKPQERYPTKLHIDALSVGTRPAYPAVSSGGPSSFSSPTVPQLYCKPLFSRLGEENHERYNTTQAPGEGNIPHADHQAQKNPEGFFTVGRVLSIHWNELADDAIPRPGSNTGKVGYGERLYGSVWYLVIVGEFHGRASCCPITTYTSRGVSRYGVDPSKHPVVNISGRPPTSNLSGRGMQKEPLSIDPTAELEDFPPMAWLRFDARFWVRHKMRVKPVGVISEESMPKFHDYIQEMSARGARMAHIN